MQFRSGHPPKTPTSAYGVFGRRANVFKFDIMVVVATLKAKYMYVRLIYLGFDFLCLMMALK